MPDVAPLFLTYRRVNPAAEWPSDLWPEPVEPEEEPEEDHGLEAAQEILAGPLDEFGFLAEDFDEEEVPREA